MRQIVQTSFLAAFLTLVAFFSNQVANAQHDFNIEQRMEDMKKLEEMLEEEMEKQGVNEESVYWKLYVGPFLEASRTLRFSYETYGHTPYEGKLRETHGFWTTSHSLNHILPTISDDNKELANLLEAATHWCSNGGNW